MAATSWNTTWFFSTARLSKTSAGMYLGAMSMPLARASSSTLGKSPISNSKPRRSTLVMSVVGAKRVSIASDRREQNVIIAWIRSDQRTRTERIGRNREATFGQRIEKLKNLRIVQSVHPPNIVVE